MDEGKLTEQEKSRTVSKSGVFLYRIFNICVHNVWDCDYKLKGMSRMKDFITGYTAGIFTVLIIGYLFVSVGLLPI